MVAAETLPTGGVVPLGPLSRSCVLRPAGRGRLLLRRHLRDQGLIGAQRWYYFQWSGRYAATALLLLSERLGALDGVYWAYLVAALVLTTAAVRLLLSLAALPTSRRTAGS